jgi:hypothetical protein
MARNGNRLCELSVYRLFAVTITVSRTRERSNNSATLISVNAKSIRSRKQCIIEFNADRSIRADFVELSSGAASPVNGFVSHRADLDDCEFEQPNAIGSDQTTSRSYRSFLLYQCRMVNAAMALRCPFVRISVYFGSVLDRCKREMLQTLHVKGKRVGSIVAR